MAGLLKKIKLTYENEEDRLKDLIYENYPTVVKLWYNRMDHSSTTYKVGKDIIETKLPNPYLFEVYLNNIRAFSINPWGCKIHDVELTKRLVE